MCFSIFRTKKFIKHLSKHSKIIQQWVDKIEVGLESNPYVGKPLGYKWIREKKYSKFRLIFVINPKMKNVYLVALADKKSQQKEIDEIIAKIKSNSP